MTDAPRPPSYATGQHLTRENPKGKLLEACARAKWLPPEIAVEQYGPRWGVDMTLHAAGRTLSSGMQWATDRTLAEQMAAKILLGELAALGEDGSDDELVTAEEATALRARNPKGALLERCTALRLTATFDVQPVVTRHGSLFEASVHVVLPDGEEVWSDIRRASVAKLAEHAAAATLLPRLASGGAPEKTPAPAPSAASGAEPRSVLNEARQKGALRDYGFTVKQIDGPPHAAVFHVAAFALRATGERIEIEAQRAPSKKEGERLAAALLVERLHVFATRTPVFGYRPFATHVRSGDDAG